jgi:hypothetical protein
MCVCVCIFCEYVCVCVYIHSVKLRVAHLALDSRLYSHTHNTNTHNKHTHTHQCVCVCECVFVPPSLFAILGGRGERDEREGCRERDVYTYTLDRDDAEASDSVRDDVCCLRLVRCDAYSWTHCGCWLEILKGAGKDENVTLALGEPHCVDVNVNVRFPAAIHIQHLRTIGKMVLEHARPVLK